MTSDPQEGFSSEDVEVKPEGSQSVVSTESRDESRGDADEGMPARWIDNNGKEVEQVFGFNENAELVNGRVAMIGFLMMIVTELVFRGEPVTRSIFGVN